MEKQQNVLVTGVNGYIGSSFLSYMSQRHEHLNFIGVDRMSNNNHRHILNNCINYNNVRLIKADFSLKEDIETVLSTHSVDTIIHFLAASRINQSSKDIFIQTNVEITNNLLEIAVQKNVNKFIFISSDEVFGDAVGNINEDSPLNPVNFYGLSKVFGESLVRFYSQNSQLTYIIARLTNVYGPSQYPDRCVPQFCCRLLDGDKCQINGTGTQKRALLYIDDCLSALELLLFTKKVNTIYNINSYERFSIKYIAKTLARMIHPNVDSKELIEYSDQVEINNKNYNISFNKILDLGWMPRVDINLGLENVIKWYKENRSLWIS